MPNLSLTHILFVNQKVTRKRLFDVAKSILFWKNEIVYPDNSPSQSLPTDFVIFFVDKIVKINASISESVIEELKGEIAEIAEIDNTKSVTELRQFKPATESEIESIISKSKNASCEMNPLPTKLLKECKEEIVPVITNIVNLSLSCSKVPKSMKCAIVRPLLKKMSLDLNLYKNYRPVSNLSFLSKIIEKLVAKRLNDYLTINNLHSPMQSAYRAFHSVETAL